jgi:putative hydrolase of the HAD superfamily
MFGAVGFDLGETLIEYEGVPLDWESKYPLALAAVAALWRGSLAAGQIENGAAVLRSYNTRLAPRRHEVDGATVFAGLLAALDAPSGQRIALLDPAADAFFSVFRRSVRAFPDSAATIDALGAAGTAVGVLTDVPYGMPRRLVLQDLSAAGLDSLAPATLSSAETGVRKPDPAGFEALARRLRCTAATMLYVGNERKDIVGAKASGMTAALVWRGDAPAPAWGQDLTVTSLEQLLPAVTGATRAPR